MTEVRLRPTKTPPHGNLSKARSRYSGENVPENAGSFRTISPGNGGGAFTQGFGLEPLGGLIGSPLPPQHTRHPTPRRGLPEPLGPRVQPEPLRCVIGPRSSSSRCYLALESIRKGGVAISGIRMDKTILDIKLSVGKKLNRTNLRKNRDGNKKCDTHFRSPIHLNFFSYGCQSFS